MSVDARIDDRTRAALRDVVRTPGSRIDPPPGAPGVIDRMLELVAPIPEGDGIGGSAAGTRLLNAQLSVDTNRPHQLRLTIDPFAGRSFWEVTRDELRDVLGRLSCAALIERSVQLHRLGYALPQTFWLGVGAGVVKAYVASAEPALRPWLGQLARDSGWLPPSLQPDFLAVHDRLGAPLALLEGIGVTFRGEQCVGTTLYSRATAPWSAVASAACAEFLGLASADSLERLADVFPTAPAAIGWALECDDAGALVDLKLELAVAGHWSRAAASRFGHHVGIDLLPVEQLAHTIAAAGLSDRDTPAPAIVSLRFVGGTLRSMVAYFPLVAT